MDRQAQTNRQQVGFTAKRRIYAEILTHLTVYAEKEKQRAPGIRSKNTKRVELAPYEDG